MGYYVSDSCKFVNSSGGAIADADFPVFSYGENAAITLVLPQSAVAANDTYRLAIDVDKTLGNGLCVASTNATISVADHTVAFSGLDTSTSKFKTSVDGRNGLVTAFIQVIRYVGGVSSANVTVLDDKCFLKCPVYQSGDTTNE